MTINSDYSDILRCFVEDAVQFLVVGGYAVLKHSEPYTTKDLYGGIEVPVLRIEDISKAKRTSGRPKDFLQAAELDRIIAKQRKNEG